MLKYRITNTYYIVKITNYITNTFNINNIINIAFSTLVNASHVCKLQFNCRRIHMNITVFFYCILLWRKYNVLHIIKDVSSTCII